MWDNVVHLILTNRRKILALIILITAFMGYNAFDVKLSHELVKMLPTSDPVYEKYEEFLDIFGEDGNIMFVGISSEKIDDLGTFNKWYDLHISLKSLEGVVAFIGIENIQNVVRDDTQKKLLLSPVFTSRPKTQIELDSLLSIVYNLHFYEGLLFNKKNSTFVSAITLNNDVLNSVRREPLIHEIEELCDEFEKETQIKVHLSGLPYIRTKTSITVRDELKLFLILAMIVASLALFFFFRSFKSFFFPMVIVGIGVVWALGLISLLGYKLTVLTGIIPPLLIIIGVENCIFLLNKYHNEFRCHGNKMQSLSQVVKRIGNATMLTNATTAVGFAAFIVTGNKILIEFGIVASVNIIFTFLLTITLVPIFYSFLPSPKRRHVKHLDKKFIRTLIQRVIHVVLNHRKWVYTIFSVFLVVGIFGITRLHTSGTIVDDIPSNDPVYKDLVFFENQFNGIMPLEIMIDTKRPQGVINPTTLNKIDQLQTLLQDYPELSRPLSIVEMIKFAKQGFYRGNPQMYELPNRHERGFIMSYLPDVSIESKFLKSLADSAMQITRVSVQMKNIGTKDIERIKTELQPLIDEIFDPEQYSVSMTGTSVVFLKGTEYLINNLLTSLVLALVIISVLIALMFNKFKMVFISLLPNLFPQILTAAMMGYFQIPIKPSTIIIFSIALGISVDNSILFLAKFRQELHLNNYNIKHSVICALKESGISMIYTFVVLFFGFIIFTASSFGGTQALGYLIAFTLSVALLSNLLLLPSVLLSIHKRSEGEDSGKKILRTSKKRKRIISQNRKILD
ncbi:MAG: MMPL family transporter [Bacteroidetes bacterium]|nr:MMPL family transporter [Bacteroidota bacterium]